MAQRFCSVCGNALADDEKFCAACGAPADQPAADNSAQAAVEQAAQGAFQAADQAAAQQSAPVNQWDNGAVPTAASSGPNIGAAIAAKKNLIIIAAAVLVVIIVAVVVITNLTKYQTIDAKDLVRVEFNGMNGKGSAVAVLNTDHREYNEKTDKTVTVKGSDYLVQSSDDDYKDRLLGAYTKAKNKGKAKDMQDVITDTNKDGELSNISFDLSEQKNLSNGDKVTVTVEFDEEEFKKANIKLENTEFEVEVEGLNVVETLDPFAYASLTFEGYDGHGTFSVEAKDVPDDLKDYISYGKSYSDDYKTSDLSNGDKVQIEAYIYGNYSPDDSDEVYYLKTKDGKYYDYGYVKDHQITKEYEVSGLTELNEYDPSADVTLQFSGYGPYKISGINKDAIDEKFRDSIYFNYDYDKEYQIGDEVEFKAYAYYELTEAGYKLKGTPDDDGYYPYSIKLTEDMVPVLISKASDAKKLSDATEQMFTEKLDSYKNNYSGYSSVSKVDVDLAKTMIAVVKNPSSYGARTIYIRIYKTTITYKDKTKQTEYYAIYGNDLVKANGEVTLTDTYLNTTSRSDIKDIESYWSDKDTYITSTVK
ncbi:MAG: zinc ribbon domain-containing protein [Ruminococcus sp.]|nr:zinc ribbon domain-containing protein [Ruminococcus sp.]